MAARAAKRPSIPSRNCWQNSLKMSTLLEVIEKLNTDQFIYILFSAWLHNVPDLISSNMSTFLLKHITAVMFLTKVSERKAAGCLFPPGRCPWYWAKALSGVLKPIRVLMLCVCSLCLLCLPFILKVFNETPEKQSHQCPILASVNPILSSTYGNLFLRCVWFVFCLLFIGLCLG